MIFAGFIGFIVFVTVLIPFLLLGGINPISLLDLPSLVLVAGVPLAIIAVNHGPKAIMALASFFFSGTMDKDQSVSSLHALKYVSISIIPIGILGTLFGSVIVFLLNTGPGVLGAGMATAVICPIYAIIIRYVIVIPTIMKLKAFARDTN